MALFTALMDHSYILKFIYILKLTRVDIRHSRERDTVIVCLKRYLLSLLLVYNSVDEDILNFTLLNTTD